MYFDYRYMSVRYELKMAVYTQEQKAQFFGSPAPANKKYREPIREVKGKARSTLKKCGNRRRANDE